jgi:hypothetical protein
MGEPHQLNMKVMMSPFLKLRFPFKKDNIFSKIVPPPPPPGAVFEVFEKIQKSLHFLAVHIHKN